MERGPGPETSPRTVDAVDITVDIMEALWDVEEPTATGLADHLDLSPSTVYNHLSTLQRRGYVVKEGYEYRPSLRFMEIGSRVRERHVDIYDPAKEVVSDLAHETGEIAWGMVEENGLGVFVIKEEGENAVESGQYSVGSRVPLHASAPGKAILAFMPDERIDEVVDAHGLNAVTPNTITDREELTAELERIRDEGVSFSDEEGAVGTQTVAVPILGRDDTVLGSISVSGPSSRISDTEFEERLPKLLAEHANIIEINVMNR